MAYNNLLRRSGGPDRWAGSHATRPACRRAAKRLAAHPDTVYVETWWGHDTGADGFSPKKLICRAPGPLYVKPEGQSE